MIGSDLMPHILFVDDEVQILNSIKRSLTRFSEEWDLSFAKSGEQALGLMMQDTVDVVVTDMKMPGMSGSDLIMEVREEHPDTVPVVLSGHSSDEEILELAKWNIPFFDKPFKAPDLVRALSRILASKLHDVEALTKRELDDESAEVLLLLTQKLVELGALSVKELPENTRRQIIERAQPTLAQIVKETNLDFDQWFRSDTQKDY